MAYIQIQRSFEGCDSNPTLQQRAVYNFYQARNSDEADDIYSDEWHQRTKRFLKQLSRPNAPPLVLKSWKLIENITFGAFFLAHPVAGYSLWNMLQACYELDRIVCVNSEEDRKTVASWQNLKPFVYLKAPQIHDKWATSLTLLKEEIELGQLEGEALVVRLFDLLRGVERLENAFASLYENFAETLKGLKLVDDVLSKICKAVDDRRTMIAKLLRGGVNEEDEDEAMKEFPAEDILCGSSAGESSYASVYDGISKSQEQSSQPSFLLPSLFMLCLIVSISIVCLDGHNISIFNFNFLRNTMRRS